jgi:tetratricopeptide (TPR) repeat protein
MAEEKPSITPPTGAPGPGDRFSPRNPLGIIALFVFLIEAIATISLKFVADTPFVAHLVWFIILYPTFISLAFFAFLWMKREAFYSPYDFRSDTTFHELLRRVEVLDAKQDAAKIDESTRPNEVIETIQRLLALGDVRAAIDVGRTLLKQTDYARALEALSYLKDKVPPSDPLHYKIRSNRGYALIGAGKYDEAITELERVRLMNEGDNFLAWHAVALSYAYLQKGDIGKSSEMLALARDLEGFKGNERFFATLYPELRDSLMGGRPNKGMHPTAKQRDS